MHIHPIIVSTAKNKPLTTNAKPDAPIEILCSDMNSFFFYFNDLENKIRTDRRIETSRSTS